MKFIIAILIISTMFFSVISAVDTVQSPPKDKDTPVEQYPEKVVSMNFDKTPVIEGTLWGIKGQYLILDKGVVNLRKFTAYEIEFTASEVPSSAASQLPLL